jgi:adenylate kinase family enzyme
MKYKKILIWGGCGHGKSTLAKEISKRINIPQYDLDNLTFNKEHTQKVTDFIRDKRLKELLKNEKWVIEGAYVGEWMHQAIKDCDLILILNISPLIAQKRVLVRFIKRKLGIEKGNGGPLRDLLRILGYARNYCKDHLVKQKELIKKFKKKAMIIKNKTQINEVLKNLK